MIIHNHEKQTNERAINVKNDLTPLKRSDHVYFKGKRFTHFIIHFKGVAGDGWGGEVAL